MGSSRFALFALIRVVALAATIGVLAWLAANTTWYATVAVVAVAAIVQWFDLLSFVNTTNREISRFLNAIEYEDLTQTFSDRGLGGSFRELGAALNRVIERLRTTRGEREEQAHYMRTLVEHVPVALLAIDERGGLTLLNSASRRLLGSRHFGSLDDLARYGEEFARQVSALEPGQTALIRMQRGNAPVQLKAAATQVLIGGIVRRLISLQSIESELNAQELAAWQALIRVLTHEMMNSLTPVSSLSNTAHALVRDLHGKLPEGSALAARAEDARDALDAVARRSEGLLHFVQSYRRLTRNLVPRMERFPVRRIFARIERLMGPDLADRGIAISASVEPETLELSADAELIDQALINLIRNAMDALKGRPGARISLAAQLDDGAGVALSVSDNGPGVDPAIRDKIFVPFYTTKRTGTGVGLSLTRQIVLVHDGAVELSETPGGGATFTLRFK